MKHTEESLIDLIREAIIKGFSKTDKEAAIILKNGEEVRISRDKPTHAILVSGISSDIVEITSDMIDYFNFIDTFNRMIEVSVRCGIDDAGIYFDIGDGKLSTYSKNGVLSFIEDGEIKRSIEVGVDEYEATKELMLEILDKSIQK